MEVLLEKIIHKNVSPVMVLFGGNPLRRHEVLKLVQQAGDITAYGTLSEEEGLEKIKKLPRVDLVLIGSRYSDIQRQRIKEITGRLHPGARFTEPGREYSYENSAIKKDIREKLGW